MTHGLKWKTLPLKLIRSNTFLEEFHSIPVTGQVQCHVFEGQENLFYKFYSAGILDCHLGSIMMTVGIKITFHPLVLVSVCKKLSVSVSCFPQDVLNNRQNSQELDI